MPNPVQELFPHVFCLEDIQCSMNEAGQMYCRAALYHDQACVTVSFECGQSGTRLEKGEFVTVSWLPDIHSDHGAIQVAGLTVLNGSAKYSNLKNFNPFQTVPRTWRIDRHLVDFARGLWDISSALKRKRIFSAVFAQPTHRAGV